MVIHMLGRYIIKVLCQVSLDVLPLKNVYLSLSSRCKRDWVTAHCAGFVWVRML